ncbi:unnamed protein product [Ectocarpus sp. 12 AP-2014]
MAGGVNTNLTYKTFPDVEFSAIKFDGIRPGKAGMKFATLVGGNGRRLVVDTPAMYIPWNTEIRKNEETGQCSSKIALSFQGMGDDEADDGKLRRFFNFLNGVDGRVKELAAQHKSELWPKKKDVDDSKIQDCFQLSVKSSANNKYPPTFQGKIPLQEGKNPSSEDVNEAMDMKVIVFRKDKTPVSPKELKGGCLASVIAEASYVWCTPMMMGISWIVKFVLVEPKASETQFQFTDMDDFSDVEDGEGTQDEVSSDNKRKRDSSGQEEEQEEQEEEEDYDEDEEEFN